MRPSPAVASSMSSRFGPATSATEAARAPSLGSLPVVFGLRCAAVHPMGCGVHLRSTSAHGAVLLAREHGALAHGYTSVFYSTQRLAAMAAQVTEHIG